jgi:hypothetical protein
MISDRLLVCGHVRVGEELERMGFRLFGFQCETDGPLTRERSKAAASIHLNHLR